jgi:AraC family transcriptional regulator
LPSQIVHDSETVRIGAFRSRPTDRDFADSGPARGHLVVFPREAVTIMHAGTRPIVADPSVVMIYNRGQQYTRSAISPLGDRCEWFAYPTEAVLEAAVASRIDVRNDERPFGELRSAPCTPRCYMLARIAFEHRELIDEVTATLLDEVLQARDDRPALTRAHVELADATRRWLAVHYAQAATLADIARVHGVSVFHLARVFRRATGRSIHGYRNQLRLRAALERLAAGDDVSTLAFDLGFSSHSHFTSAFHRAFGVTPSQLRPSKILTAARRLVAR